MRTLINSFKKWLAKRREAKRIQSFWAGYYWALNAYYHEAKSLAEIQAYVDGSTLAFDLGVNHAIAELERMEAPNDFNS